MNKLILSCIGITCSAISFSPASQAEEIKNSNTSSKSQKFYIESSFGLRGYDKHNYKLKHLGDTDYSKGRWMDTEEGTDWSINIGYYITEDLRVSLGYKRVVEQLKSFRTRHEPVGYWQDDVSHQIDAYVLNIYKDFPIQNSPWTAYIGAGLGPANLSKTAAPSHLIEATSDNSFYKQAIAGLTYSYKKYDLFGEISYGGVGKTTWNGVREGVTLVTKNTISFAGSFGVRMRF